MPRVAWLLGLAVLLAGPTTRGGDDGPVRTFEWHHPLYTAIAENDMAALRRILDEDPGLLHAVLGESGKPLSIEGLTPLHLAAKYGKIEIVAELIRRGANVNLRTVDGWTPLHYALFTGSAATAPALVAGGAELDAFIAAALGDLPALEDLYRRDQLIVAATFGTDGWTALHCAAARGQTEVVRWLIERGAAVDASPEDNGTPLHFAAWRGHIDAARALLDHGADPDAVGLALTPLHAAAHAGHVTMITTLLEHGADVNGRGCPGGPTPIFSALVGGQGEAAAVLIENGADVNALSTDCPAPNMAGDGPRSPLDQTVMSREPRIAALLLEHGAKLHAVEREELDKLLAQPEPTAD